jgi:hypothetical protein
MPIQAVTFAIRDVLLAALHEGTGLPPNSFAVYVGPPDVDRPQDELILFLLRITPNGELRNAERVRRSPNPLVAAQTFEPAVPLDLHYLVTAGSPANATAGEALHRLGRAIMAITQASPLSVPSHFQDAVWLSMESMTTDELSRIWGLFPNFNCRTSFVFRASPVWLDPSQPVHAAEPVIDQDTTFGIATEAA